MSKKNTTTLTIPEKKITSNLPTTKAAQAQAIKDSNIAYMLWFHETTKDLAMVLPAQYLVDFNCVRTKVLERLQNTKLNATPLTHHNLIFGLLTNTEPSLAEIKKAFRFDLPQSEIFIAFIKSTLTTKKSLRRYPQTKCKRLKANYPLLLKDLTSPQDALKALDKMFIQYYLKILYPYSHGPEKPCL